MTAKTAGKLPRPLLIAVRTYEEFEQLMRLLDTSTKAAMLASRVDIVETLMPIIEQFLDNHVWDTYNCGKPECERCSTKKQPKFTFVDPSEGDA